MAATGFTPIQLYYSTTASAAPAAGNLANGELAINITDGKLYYKDNGGVVQVLATKAGASGDVVGPGSSTDNALVRFDSTTGKLVQNSVGILDDSGNLSGLAAVTMSGALTLNGGTANGVAYLNASKVLTTGSALTFDGTTLTATRASGGKVFEAISAGTASYSYNTVGANSSVFGLDGTGTAIINLGTGPIYFYTNSSEQMRLTSTGLGIGTSSPFSKLDIKFATDKHAIFTASASYSNSADLVAVNDSGSEIALGLGGSNVRFYTGATERMRLDSSGNLGLGVTPSAGNATASYKLFEVGAAGGASLYAGPGQTLLSTNIAWDGGTARYKVSSVQAMQYTQESGLHAWKVAPSGTAGNAISFTQAMTLDASGNLGIGTTAPTFAFEIDRVVANGNMLRIKRSGISGEFQLYQATNLTYLDAVGASSSLVFATNAVERARIDSSGNLLVGGTSPNESFAGVPTIQGATNCIFTNRRSSTSSSSQFRFYNPNGLVGEISTSGSSTTYATSSDYRLKEAVQPMTGALAKVAALKPCTYKWKADGSDGEGFIAHELAEVVPACVTGEKDAVDAKGNPKYQGIDTSFLVATLTAAIQEQQAIIDTLTARVAALEN